MSTGFIVIAGVAFVAVAFRKQFARVLALLVVRKAFRGALEEVGRQALAKTQDVVTLHPEPGYQWMNSSIEAQYVNPLRALGFTDAGIYSVQQMAGVHVRMLVHEQDRIHANVYEHPQAGHWLELVSRYENNDVFTVTNLRSQGIDRPSWLTTVRVEVPTALLVQRLLKERKQAPLRPATVANAVDEFEAGYARFMAWKKQTGISAAEVARQIERRAGAPVA